MRTVSQAVKRILNNDHIAKEAMEDGLLNFSAYAKRIKPQIDEWLFKDVTHGSIVVALSRMQEEVKEQAKRESLVIYDISLQTNIVERIFKNEIDAQQALHSLSNDRESGGFFVIMQGFREITLLCRASDLSPLSFTPVKSLDNLSAITIRLDGTVIDQPNIFYRIMKPLIAQSINIIEIITGLGEVTFVIRQEDTKTAFDALESLRTWTFPTN